MRATEMPVPSYRLARESAGVGGGSLKRVTMIGGSLLVLGAVGMAGWWGLSRVSGGGVPVIEADPRPFRVRPSDPGGMQVPNQNDLIFDRNSRSASAQQGARLAPEAETPRLQALREQVQPPPMPAPRQAAPAPQTAAPPQQQAAPAPAAPAPAAPQAQQRTPAATGRVQVQLGAVISQDAAQAEYERISRRMPELFSGRSPAFTRTERDGQTLWRIRTGGFADRAAATQFCEQLRARSIACTVPAN